jgi:hypothetical protein
VTQKLKCLISPCTNPVSILSVPTNPSIKPLTPIISLTQPLVHRIEKNPYLFNWHVLSSAFDL